MKKFLGVLSIIMIGLLFVFTSVYAKDDGNKKIYFENINTLNFLTYSGYENFNEISKICSYDYCDYIASSNPEEALDIFTKKYLKNITSEEEKASIRIKGLRITEVILKN